MIRPFRVSLQGLILQAISTSLVIAVTGYAVRAYFTGTYAIFKEKHVLLVFDRALFLFFITMIVFIFGNFFWIGFRLVRPLEHIIRKTRRLFASQGINVGEALARKAGFWSEIDLTLDLLKKELEKKSDLISREHAEIEAVMSSVHEAILAIDVKERPLFFNSEFLLQFGGKDFTQRRPPLFEIFRAPEILEAFKAAISQGKKQVAIADLFTGPDSKRRHFSISVSPLRKNPGESIYGAVGVFTDITELKRAEQIRIEFVGNVSHELRTPLTSIKGYAGLLRDDLETGAKGDLLQHIEIISRNVSRLMDLVNDLLDLSSLESGGAEMVKSEVDPCDLTQHVLTQLEPQRSQRGHQFHFDCKVQKIHADPKRLEQVVTNLIENAIRHTPTESQIDVFWTEGKPGFVRFHVKDNGPGIPLEHQPRLFERFYRVDHARTRDQGGGTGLGLAIVKHVVQRHGGSVKVWSEPGRGTEFICELPKG